MIGMGHKKDDDMEYLFELIEACLQEDGYEVTRFENTKVSTSAYRGAFVKDRNGRVYTFDINKKWKD